MMVNRLRQTANTSDSAQNLWLSCIEMEEDSVDFFIIGNVDR